MTRHLTRRAGIAAVGLLSLGLLAAPASGDGGG